MAEENIYLEAIDTTPLIKNSSVNEDAFTLRSGTIAPRPKSYSKYIKVFLVLLFIVVIVTVIVNSTLYTDQLAEYKNLDED